ncbi:MAG: WD40 repeat domain-containing serine/threonine protein kinase, partial [Pirellulales bacterium]
MGTVYRAFDTEQKRQVALKVLPPRLATPDSIGRFRREAFVALQLRHNHVVTSFELGQHGSLHFLVMDLVDGPSLSAHLAKQRRLSVRETARIGYEVALALEHARELGIIHRDIKPSNILLSRRGHVKVADMGLAKFFGPQAQAGGPDTRTGQFMGTIDYCSPEQAVDAKRADIRSDIYSLGCTLYHCLTGKPPFADGTEVQRIMAHIDILPASIRVANRDVPLAFADLIEKRMLSKDPGDRFQTPAEAAEALLPWFKEGEAASANPWAGLESLEGLLEVAAQAPRVDAPRAATPQSGRDTVRRRPARLTSRPRKLRLGAKSESVLWRPMTLAALVLVILSAVVGASLWWPRQKADDVLELANLQPGLNGQDGRPSAQPNEGTTDRDDLPAKPPDGDGTDGPGDSGVETVAPPVVVESSSDDAKGDGEGPASPPGPSADPGRNAIAAEKQLSEPVAPNVPGLLLTVKHGAPVTAVAVSADGSTLVTGGNDKTARLWNGADDAPRGSPWTHSDQRPISFVGISADGRYTVTGTHWPFYALSGGYRPLSRGGAKRRSPVAFLGYSKDPTYCLWDVSAGGGNGGKPLLT